MVAFHFVPSFLLMAIYVIGAAQGSCSASFDLIPNVDYYGSTSCYYGFSGSSTHPVAKALCESGGAHLLFLETTAELLELRPKFPGGNQIWLGVEKISSIWKWVDGATQKDAITNFQSGAGNNKHAVMSDFINGDKWLGTGTSASYRVICEMDHAVVTSAVTTMSTSTSMATTASQTTRTTSMAAVSTTTSMVTTATSTATRGSSYVMQGYFRKRNDVKNTAVLLNQFNNTSCIKCATLCFESEDCIGFLYYSLRRVCEQLGVAVGEITCLESDEYVCFDKI